MPDRAARLAETITRDFYDDGGEGLRLPVSASASAPPRTWREMPEVKAVEEVTRLADSRGARLFLTFVSAMNRNRDFFDLLDVALRLFTAQPQLFEPSHAAALPLPELARALKDSDVSRKHDPDSKAWSAIAKSLTETGAVRAVIETGVGDAVDILRELGPRGRFPLLRGPKIAPLWLGMLAAPGGARIANLRIAPVAVDVHVRRASEALGVCETRGWPSEIAREAVQRAWRDAVRTASVSGPAEAAGTCAALNAPLWTLGKFGCDAYQNAG